MAKRSLKKVPCITVLEIGLILAILSFGLGAFLLIIAV